MFCFVQLLPGFSYSAEGLGAYCTLACFLGIGRFLESFDPLWFSPFQFPPVTNSVLPSPGPAQVSSLISSCPETIQFFRQCFSRHVSLPTPSLSSCWRSKSSYVCRRRSSKVGSIFKLSFSPSCTLVPRLHWSFFRLLLSAGSCFLFLLCCELEAPPEMSGDSRLAPGGYPVYAVVFPCASKASPYQ